MDVVAFVIGSEVILEQKEMVTSSLSPAGSDFCSNIGAGSRAQDARIILARAGRISLFIVCKFVC